MKFQREQGDKLVDAQHRKAERREDLLRIVGSMGISRSNLTNPMRWNEVARSEMSYEPDRALVAMIRDVARTARQRCTKAQQQAVRRAITLYVCRTLYNEVMEPLGTEDHSGDVLTLYCEKEREESEADSAIAVSLQAPNPTNDERAAREVEEAAIATKRVADSLRERAKRAAQAVLRGGETRVLS